jgi:hypothetical protein
MTICARKDAQWTLLAIAVIIIVDSDNTSIDSSVSSAVGDGF